MKCELVTVNEEDDEYDTLFNGTIDCAPAECQIVMHKGQAFVYADSDEEIATYVLTKVAEFSEEAKEDE
jgi:hypothetical protein